LLSRSDSSVAAPSAASAGGTVRQIERRLLDQCQAVLGAVPRLVYPHRNGVKWDPADHLCVAGELLPIEPVDNRWAIKGDIVELHS
jgi:hypothetical protein